jgi:hypothetical protein
MRIATSTLRKVTLSPFNRSCPVQTRGFRTEASPLKIIVQPQAQHECQWISYVSVRTKFFPSEFLTDLLVKIIVLITLYIAPKVPLNLISFLRLACRNPLARIVQNLPFWNHSFQLAIFSGSTLAIITGLLSSPMWEKWFSCSIKNGRLQRMQGRSVSYYSVPNII